jgi:hypothetical protein
MLLKFHTHGILALGGKGPTKKSQENTVFISYEKILTPQKDLGKI